MYTSNFMDSAKSSTLYITVLAKNNCYDKNAVRIKGNNEMNANTVTLEICSIQLKKKLGVVISFSKNM